MGQYTRMDLTTRGEGEELRMAEKRISIEVPQKGTSERYKKRTMKTRANGGWEGVMFSR